MRVRMPLFVAGALAAVAVPAVMVWSWVSLLSVFEGPAGPAPRAQPPDLAPSGAVAGVDPVPPASAAPPPLPPRADYRALPSRIAPQPVVPEPAVKVASAAPGPVMPPAPSPSGWAKVEIVNPFGVGSPAPAVGAAVRSSLRADLARCFQRDEEARFGLLGRAFSTVSPGDEPAAGPAILLLEVEASGDGVRVVDAPVERRGTASDGTLNCAQSVLRGASVKAGAEGKKRFRMRFQLRP